MSTAGGDWRRVVADIGRVQSALGRSRLGLFSIEGTRLHERALRAGVALEAVVVGREFAASAEPRERRLLAEIDAAGCARHVVPDEVLVRLTAGRRTGALVGLVRLPDPPRLNDVLSVASRRAALLLVAVEVEEPGNVGALTRTALAGMADGLAAVGISDPFHPKAVRTSMGAVFKIPILRYRRLDDALRELRGRGVECLGAVSRDGTPLPQLAPQEGPRAVLIGGEAFGLEGSARAAVDRLVTIPMSPRADSLSVNAAAAILLYELRRPG